MDLSIVNVALPSIQQDLGFSQQSLQWVVSGYILAFGGFLLLGGRLADLLGRRRIFVAGLAVFAASSLVGGLATGPAMLVTARIVQGLGAALMAPAALSILTTTFGRAASATRPSASGEPSPGSLLLPGSSSAGRCRTGPAGAGCSS
ncbi:MFS transporter [Streptomyces albicerus]|uniref:MFS transporter n=1 Tax=Streptomyces albicerus TaxID=2569859 RepID=UPI0021F233CF|nr:MFS transporter [Streptomyces albicerus]